MRAKPGYLVAAGFCGAGAVSWLLGAHSVWEYVAGAVCIIGTIISYREWRRSLKGASDG